MAYDPTKPPELTPEAPKYTATQATGATYDAAKQNVGSNSLVQNQMTGLLAKNNPYMQQAATIGKQAANKTGLLNTSMGIGAVENARISAALPIAQQDASTFANQELTNQQYENTARQFNAETGTQVNLENANAQNQAGMFNAETQSNRDMAAFGEAGTNYRANLEKDMQTYLADLEFGVKNKESFLTFANENNQQFMVQISEIMRSRDIKAYDKSQMINELQAVYKANFDLAAQVADYPLEWVTLDINANTKDKPSASAVAAPTTDYTAPEGN